MSTFTRTSIGNALYGFTKSGKISRTSVSINLSSFVAVLKLRVTFLYFKDWSFREYSNTLILYNIIATSLPIYPACFLKNTPVNTDQGIIPINNKKIVAISKTITPEDHLIYIKKDTLGDNVPSEDTVISCKHILLYDEKMTKASKICKIMDNVHKVDYS
jgi:hypothetical protein